MGSPPKTKRLARRVEPLFRSPQVNIDLEEEFLSETVELLDSQLGRLEESAEKSGDPDGFGLYDRIEYVTGLGFVACQNYIASWVGMAKAMGGISKEDALSRGEIHRSGQPLAAIVYAAANFWKHRPDRIDEPKPHKATADALTQLGVPFSAEYAVSRFLYELVRPLPQRFNALIPFLTRWRESLPLRR